MNLRIQNQSQPDIDSSATLKSGTPQTGASLNSSRSANSAPESLSAAQDTASISSAPSQLSGDVPIRQDRVDALRTQMESGTYSVNSHAVATAMFQNLFRS
jgi:flagellar biosynthesis anti-sigma factor FlgM